MIRLALFLALLAAACGSGASTTDRVTDTPVATLPPAIGEIVFGLDFDPDTLDIIDPTSRFQTTYPEIAYAAYFRETANAAALRLVIASVSASGSEQILVDQSVPISNPAFDSFANKLDLATLVGNAPGDYVMRYLRDATTLAEGTFTLVAP